MSSNIFHIQAPKLPKQLSAEVIKTLENNSEYTSVTISGNNVAGQKAENVLFEQTRIRRVSFAETNIIQMRLFDSRIDDSDLSSAQWEKARFHRVEFIGCRFLGIQLMEAEIEDILFRECILENAIFVAASIKSALFEQCNLQNISVESTKLTKTIFHKCDLTNARFIETKLSGVDLRGSTINRLQIDPKEINGAIIDSSQALQVVGLLGVIINDFDNRSHSSF